MCECGRRVGDVFRVFGVVECFRPHISGTYMLIAKLKEQGRLRGKRAGTGRALNGDLVRSRRNPYIMYVEGINVKGAGKSAVSIKSCTELLKTA